MNLQKKYFLIFFSLFVLLSIAMSTTTYYLSNHIMLGKYEEMSADSLSYLLQVTEKELDQLSSTFVFIANDPSVNERITRTYTELDNYSKLVQDLEVTSMFNAMSSFDIFSDIEIMYMKGSNGAQYWYGGGSDFIDADAKLKGIDFEHISMTTLEYHGILRNNNPYSDSIYVLAFTKSLVDGMGGRVGRVYFELDAEYFKRLYDNQKLGIDANLFLVDGDDNIIYSDDMFMVGRSFSSIDKEGVVVIQDMDKYGWRLISESPVSQIYEESDSILRVTALMGIISILIALVLIIIITSKIVQPIKALSRALKDVRQGDLSKQVYHISHDEIGELTSNFNEMTLQLKGNLDKEIAYNKAINDAEYKALQAQINPHFMYNALNALKWLAGIQKADNIIELVDALWTLLRMTSSFKGQTVTLGEEIEVIKAYCAIQQVRYKGKFEVIYDVPVDLMQARIPKYILQPFVENAIFHGIEPKRGTGTIIVRAIVENEELSIYVEDDGVGIDEMTVKKLLVDESVQQYGAGLNNIGVKNIKERLLLLYGPEHGIRISSELGVGTTMMIHLPLKGSQEEDLLKKVD